MRRLLVVFALILIIAGLTAMEVRKRWETPLNLPPQGYTLTVAAGDSLRSVSTSTSKARPPESIRSMIGHARFLFSDTDMRRITMKAPCQTKRQTNLTC